MATTTRKAKASDLKTGDVIAAKDAEGGMHIFRVGDISTEFNWFVGYNPSSTRQLFSLSTGRGKKVVGYRGTLQSRPDIVFARYANDEEASTLKMEEDASRETMQLIDYLQCNHRWGALSLDKLRTIVGWLKEA